MRTLSEVFAPGAPTLPEGLRTLVVSPDRELEPGMTVRATFTFRNHGGAPATGVRVRFNLPEGLVYLVGTGQLEGADLDDEQGNSPLLARSGASIGDVAPGEERRIDIAYSVAGAIENGTTIELQAAVASFEVPPVGSNVVRLIARSRPQLHNALTSIAIETRAAEATPGSEAQITVRVHNAGESSARDVVVVAPIPEHTRYVAGSARVNGRDIERDLGLSFDRLYAPIVAASLPASASTTLVYRVRIDSPLPDATAVRAEAHVASQETPAFALDPVAITVRAYPAFGDDRTNFTVEPSQNVRAGGRVTLSLGVYNAGSAAAETVTATLQLPDGLVPVRGSARIDGRPVRVGKKESLVFDLGRIDAEARVELQCDAIVAAPVADGAVLSPQATLAWEPASSDGGERTFSRQLDVRSEPAFPVRRNTFVRTGIERVRPSEEIEATILLANDGSAAASDCVLHVSADPGYEDVRLSERATRLVLDGDAAELGTLEAYSSRRITVRARVRTPYTDRSELRLAASLHCRELGETPLGHVHFVVDSHPGFTAGDSRLELLSEDRLRPNQLADVALRLRNVGSDSAHNVRVRLYVSPEARLESVDGATREKSTLVFGDVAPGATAEARLGLRLLRGLAKEYPVTVDAVVTADAMLPVPLERLTVATAAEPDFAIGTLRAESGEFVDAGETVEWTLHVRNGGDGPARRVQIVVTQPESLIYVPNSTTVNDVPIRDVGAASALTSERGIVINDVDPGVEATIRWRDVVHNGLAAGETIGRVASVRYDGEREDRLSSNEVKVRATPVFANAIPGLPFGLDGMIGPAFGGGQRALSQERFMELPPATPVNGSSGDHGRAMLATTPITALEDGWDDAATAAELPGSRERDAGIVDAAVTDGRTGTLVTFTGSALARTGRFLDEARFEGMVTHIFALRAFLPDAIGSAHVGSLSALRDVMREEIDRLWIKLRLPNYVIAPRDVETPSMRGALERLLHEAQQAHGVPADAPGASVAFRGSFDPVELREAAEALAGAELAVAAPWRALAHLLPDGTPQFAHYRAMLIERLSGMTELESSDFMDALQRRRDVALDAALDVVRTSLYAARG